MIEEVGRFLDLAEGQIASSMLSASGLNPVLLDEARASVLWDQQFAIGGVRLCVPASEVETARALLADAEQRAAHQRRPHASKSAERGNPLWMVATLIASVFIGWPLVALKGRNRLYKAFAWLWIFGVGAFLVLAIMDGFRR